LKSKKTPMKKTAPPKRELKNRMASNEKALDDLTLMAQGLNQLPQGITIFNANLELVAWNDAAMDVLELPHTFAKKGTRLGDVLRFNAARGDYGEGDVEEQVRARIEVARMFEPHKFERTLPSGKIIEVQGEPLPGGGFVTIYTDVTESRTTEQALRWIRDDLDKRVAERTEELEKARDALTSERKHLQTTLENMSQGISLFDANLKAVVLNKRYQELLDFPDELMKPGTHISEFFRYNAERGEYGDGDIETLVGERVELAKKFEPHRFLRKRPDGSTIEIIGVPLDGGGFVSTYEDITVRVEAEEAIKKADQAKSNFLAKMSHELRTPLNAIIGLSEMLGEEARSDGNEGYSEPLERIVGAGHHLLAIINDILDLSKIEAGKTEIHWERTPLEQVVDQIKSTVSGLAKRRGNRLTVELHDVPKYMRSDPLRLRQILLNLLGNAIKFTENGEIKLSLSRCKEAGKESVLFVVEDTGIGIPNDKLDGLFDEFSQVPEQQMLSQNGTGLGLAICKKTVEMMGGTIGVESTVGEGSWFWFKLPVG